MKRLMVGLLVVSTSCSLTVPSKYHMPQPIHTARLDRVSVGGFSRVEFRQTGSSVAAWDNSAAAVAVTADTYGNVAAAGAAARNSGFASSYSGYYQATSDTPEFKRDLENTRCAKVVSTTAPASDGVGLIGSTSVWQHDGVLNHVVNTCMVLFQLGWFGTPGQHVVYGVGTVREFRGEEFIREHTVRIRYPYLVSLYTYVSEDRDAIPLVRSLVLRDLADQVASDLCN